MTERRFGIYARVSTNDGKQNYQRQIDDLTNLIKKKHGDNCLIEIFSENVSGYKKGDIDRPKLTDLLQKVRKNPQLFSTIYVSEISRLGRDPKVTREIVEEFTELGVNIHIQSLGIDTINSDGKRNFITSIILQVLIEYANLEAETFKDRSRSGLLRSARSGKVGGGKFFPYGYTKDDNNMLVIDEEESKTVKQIFNLYLEGNGTKKISNILNSYKIPTKLNRIYDNKVIKYKNVKKTSDICWSDTQVRSILINPIYIGKRRFKGEFIDCPIIIDESLFNECNQQLKSKNTKGDTVYVFLLKGIIKCGICGRNYVGRYKPTPNGDKVYKCSSTRDNTFTCTNTGINIKFLESTIFHLISITSNSAKFLNTLPDLQDTLTKEINRIEREIVVIDHQIAEVKKNLDKILDLYLNSNTMDVKILDEKNDSLKLSLKKLELKRDVQNKSLKTKTSQIKKTTYNDQSYLKNIKKSRLDLQKVFRDIIQEVKVIQTSKDEILLSVEINLYNDNKFYIHIVLHKNGLRKKDKQYSYHIEKFSALFNGQNFVLYNRENVRRTEKILDQKLLREDIISYNYDNVSEQFDNNADTKYRDRHIFKIFEEIISPNGFDYHSKLAIPEDFLIEMID